jgi:hypothetical protein
MQSVVIGCRSPESKSSTSQTAPPSSACVAVTVNHNDTLFYSQRVVEERVFRGYNGNLVLSDAGVKITRRVKGIVLQQSLRGEKLIPWQSIVAVQYKKAGVNVGYLQLSLRGGSEAKGAFKEALLDENTVTWVRAWPKNAEFAEARDLILEMITSHASSAKTDTSTKTCPDCAEEVKEAAKVCRFCGYRFTA